jgi:chromate transporter
MSIITTIILQFSLLSLLAFGGANAVIPEIHRIAVDANHWMSSTEFAHLFAISQATPGPNIIIVTLVGWHVAGLAGAVAATLAICGPSSILMYVFMQLWNKAGASYWRRAVQTGVAPLAVGLVLASGWIITRASDETVWAYTLTGLTLLITMNFKLNPIWLIAGGAVLGLSGIV